MSAARPPEIAAGTGPLADAVAGPQEAAASAQRTADERLDLELLQLCFDEAEFGHLGGALRPQTGAAAASPAQGASDGGDEAALEFDPQQFVASKLDHVAANVLERDLATYAAHLEAAVVKCVHEEVHEAFVHVSGQLVSMESNIAKAQQPLEDIEGRVARSRATLEAARDSAREDLAEATAHEQQRAFCAAALEASLVHNAAQRALAKVAEGAAAAEKNPSGPNKVDESAVKRDRESDLVFIVTSSARLAELVEDLEGMLPADASKDDRDLAAQLARYSQQDIERAKDLSCAQFLVAHDAYVDAPSSERAADLTFITDLLVQLLAPAAIGTFVKERVVRPVVEDVISWKAVSAAKSSPTETERIFTTLLERLRGGVLVALPIVQKRLGAEPCLIATSVWPAIGDTIMRKLVHFFSPGLPNTFHRCFRVAAALITALEDSCSNAAELHALRSSRDMAVWRAKWDLEVYHQLRRNELEQRLKAAGVLNPPFRVNADGAATGQGEADIRPFSIRQFHGVMEQLRWLLDPATVFLYPAQHMFLRDACDTLRRFLEAVRADAAAAEPLVVVELIRNCTALAKCIDASLSDTVRVALEDDAAAAAVTQFLRRMVENGVAVTRRCLIEGLVNKCMASLTHVSSVKRIFSSGSGPMPSQPSAYLHDALKDVHAFKAQAARSSTLSETEAKDVVLEVLDETTRGMTDAVQAALVSAKRQQDSLDKLQRNRGSSASKSQGGAAQAEKPREKITLQLYLDVHEYGDMLRKFGVNKEVYKPFQALLALVGPRAQWVLGNCEGPEPDDTTIAAAAASA